jgi:hypothetical protein
VSRSRKVEDRVFVAFSMPRQEAAAMHAMARRLGYATTEILLAELAKIGWREMATRFDVGPRVSRQVRAPGALARRAQRD